MTPVDFKEANAHFGPPPGLAESQVRTVRAYCGPIDRGSLEGEKLVVVAWRPSEAELEAIINGAPIFMTAVGGLPPHFLSTDFATAISPA